MSDIVERLRHRNTPFGWSELADKAADEIEKLRTATEYAFGPSGELAKCRAEIERLRAELQDVKWQLLRAQRKLGYAEPEVARAALEGRP